MGAKASIRGRGRQGMLVGALMMTTALVPVLAAAPAMAQQGPADSRIPQLNAEHDFNIPAQPLTSALAAFGQQSGLQVTVNGALVRGMSAPPVRGAMPATEGLRQLLAGSGLTYVISGSTIVIQRAAGQGSDGAIQLGPVRVEGQESNPHSTMTPMPAYAGG